MIGPTLEVIGLLSRMGRRRKRFTVPFHHHEWSMNAPFKVVSGGQCLIRINETHRTHTGFPAMLIFVAFSLIALSLLVEWAFHLIKENIEIEWPVDAGRKAIDRRARAARMRGWTALH